MTSSRELAGLEAAYSELVENSSDLTAANLRQLYPTGGFAVDIPIVGNSSIVQEFSRPIKAVRNRGPSLGLPGALHVSDGSGPLKNDCPG
jgi:hypothetical protein